MSSGFSDSFRYYLPPSEDVIKSGMTSGLIVPDTNVLLSAYRFAPAAREELLSVLARIADRIWIPNRVAEEFHRNRLGVISDRDAVYLPVIDSLRQAQQGLDDELQPKIAQLANRAALSEGEKSNLYRLVAASTAAATSAAEELRKAHGLANLRGDDAILSRYQELLNGKTGTPFAKEEADKAIDEAMRRIEDRIPPGYLDAKKEQPYGDYFVWKQTMLEVARRRVRYLIFVTTDNKEDWYQIIKGQTVGARPELTKELMGHSNAQLVMLSTASFLFHAREHLNAEVSPETIRQSEALPSSERVPERVIRQNEKARARLADMDRLARRIESRQAVIRALQETLVTRSEDDPDTRALQNQLTELQRSERILRRRYGRLQDSSLEDTGLKEEDISTSDDDDDSDQS